MAFNFKKAAKPTFKQKVTVPLANDKGGFDDQTFDAIFKRAAEEERKELAKLPDAEVCRRQLVDWDLKDEEGNDVPFDEETRESVLAIAPSPNYIAKAFWNGMTGGVLKN